MSLTSLSNLVTKHKTERGRITYDCQVTKYSKYISKNTDTYGPTEPDLCDTVRMPGLVVTSNLATQHLASRKIFFSVLLGLS